MTAFPLMVSYFLFSKLSEGGGVISNRYVAVLLCLVAAINKKKMGHLHSKSYKELLERLHFAQKSQGTTF